jgi:transcriptional regulator with XRE-family HTH domain
MDQLDLGSCLRSWRDRLDPADVGLSVGPRRRAPGLRRQELAMLAGISVEYLARLEQGRTSSPSPSVLTPLARALRLSTDEHDHLFRLARQAPPTATTAGRHVTPSVHRIIDRLGDTALLAIDVAWDVVLANPLATALLGADATRPGVNLLRRHFSSTPTRVVHTAAQNRAFETGAVADLRTAMVRFPDDERLHGLVDELRSSSEAFAERWESPDLTVHASAGKTVRHPEVGEITLDCDTLAVTDSTLRLVVYTAVPRTRDAQSLELLATIGSQRLRRDHRPGMPSPA